jgi:hypothetical protein
MLVRRATAVVCLTLGLALGCARSDLGSPCHLQDVNGAELHPLPGRDYIYLGSSECESFACIATAGTTGGYCSQACSGAGGSCPSGMTCSQISLNPPYLAAMKAQLPPDQYTSLFGQLNGSWYCTPSR